MTNDERFGEESVTPIFSQPSDIGKTALGKSDDTYTGTRAQNQRLTVVIPVFNGATSIARAIESAWASGADQVIVVDDGSTDESAEIAKDAGCEVITQHNAGAAAARRAGVALADNDYVALLDADDRLIPEGVEESLKRARSTTEWSVIGGVTIGVTALGKRTVFRPWLGTVTPLRLIHVGFSPCPPAAFIWKRSVLFDAMFDDTPAVWPKYAEDYELLIRASLKGPVVFHGVPSAEYALEGGKSTIDPTLSIRASEEIRQNYANILGLSLRRRSEHAIRSRALLRLAKSNDSAETQARRLRLIVHSIALDPIFMSGFLGSALWNRVRTRVLPQNAKTEV